ncbi:hypothetical protein [Roseobacter sp. HKCCA0434]|uniref:hypothetical protein n=1 Tax=Roseobacter sp. HKCCA0434 TaxID=3079297 RepID=UPI0029058910|nr:hypothetical protein [Roseobacter sp. HKCCA0434]
MKKILIALATATTLAATGAFADAHEEMTMGEGLTMFEALVANELAEYDIEADVTMLTLGQLAQIRAITETDENTEKKREDIMAIVSDM